jgi:2',3'-cyclic-nucleotide 2'-phosphodiesterase (5'-nucleotidase family)
VALFVLPSMARAHDTKVQLLAINDFHGNLQPRVSGVGNHEFDEGVKELLRMQRGGCHPTDGCQDGDPFSGAFFQYLAANVF